MGIRSRAGRIRPTGAGKGRDRTLHNRRIADAALQFIAAHPIVVSILTGAASIAEVKANVESFTRSVPAGFWKVLKDERAINSLLSF